MICPELGDRASVQEEYYVTTVLVAELVQAGPLPSGLPWRGWEGHGGRLSVPGSPVPPPPSPHGENGADAARVEGSHGLPSQHPRQTSRLSCFPVFLGESRGPSRDPGPS